MNNQDVTNLFISREIIIKIIPFIRQISTEFFFAGQINKEEFSQIFEEIELPLRRIADEMAVVVNEKFISPVNIYRRRVKSVSENLQDVIENSGDFQTLIQKLQDLVDYFQSIILTREATYPETTIILDNIESILN